MLINYLEFTTVTLIKIQRLMIQKNAKQEGIDNLVLNLKKLATSVLCSNLLHTQHLFFLPL